MMAMVYKRGTLLVGCPNRLSFWPSVLETLSKQKTTRFSSDQSLMEIEIKNVMM